MITVCFYRSGLHRKSFQHLVVFFMPTWWGNCKNVKEIEISRWLFELCTCKLGQPFSPSDRIFFAPSWSALKRPSCELNFLHISAIPSSSIDMKNVVKCWNGILLPKLFWPTVRKNCSSDREKLLKFEAEGFEFAKILRSLEQFFQTVKGQNNLW